MPRANLFEPLVDKATSEYKTSEDWSLIMDICDKVKHTPNGPKDCLRCITKKLINTNPHVVLSALTLLDACIKNCGRTFHLEVCSRHFEEIIKSMITKKSHQKVVSKLMHLLKKWVEDFKNDPQLSLMSSLYNTLKNDVMEFNCEEAINLNKETFSGPANEDRKEITSQQEEEDIAKAIELSLKETSTSPKSASSLYPFACPPSPTSVQKTDKEPRKVRALYDFEAAEDNELTFKTGEIVLVLDDSDSNWWKGSNHRGEGLFPSNFVTSNLNAEPEIPVKVEKKTVQFSEEVKVKTVEDYQELEIDEGKIDNTLHMLHEADPTGEQPESEELLSFEEQCVAMGPLIDRELEQIDRKHNSLASLSQQFMDAVNLYHSLMKDCSTTAYSQYPPPDVMHSYAPQQQMYINPAPPPPQAYLPPEHYQCLQARNNIEQQYSVTGSTGSIPTVLPAQNSYSASGSFNSISPNSITSSVYSVGPDATPIISSYYNNTSGPQLAPLSNSQHSLPPPHTS